MQSAFRERYGPPDVLSLRDLPIPEPGHGEILVHVRAATVNRTDCAVLSGTPYIYRFILGWPKPREGATGTDFAGEVIAVGSGVDRFAAGDRVMGFNDNNLGSHAEYVCISRRDPIIRIPEGVPFESAAASMEGAHYALNFINKVALKPGDRLLVNGATGAIGSAAIVLLKQAGAEVTAICSGQYRDAVLGLGADRIIDRDTAPFTEQLAGETFDFVFDAVGKSTFGVCRPLLTPEGIYISSEPGPGGQNLFLALAAPLMRGPKVVFPVPTNIAATLEAISPLLADGTYRPLIDRTYALSELRDAFTYVASGQKIGNVILVP